MPRGRKKKLDRPVHWSISVPQSLAAELELLLIDPLRGKPKHGARGALIERLLREWVEEQKKKA